MITSGTIVCDRQHSAEPSLAVAVGVVVASDFALKHHIKLENDGLGSSMSYVSATTTTEAGIMHTIFFLTGNNKHDQR